MHPSISGLGNCDIIKDIEEEVKRRVSTDWLTASGDSQSADETNYDVFRASSSSPEQVIKIIMYYYYYHYDHIIMLSAQI